MLPIERQSEILELLQDKHMVKINELVEAFDISIETVRRDLKILEEQGKIRKVYGGITLSELQLGEPTIDHRLNNNFIYKDKIGQKCCEFIKEGDCIFIDSGTTTYQIAKYIKDFKNIMVITNSIPVINELINTDIELIIIGGKIRHSELSVVAYDYLFNFSTLNITKSFICTSGITINKGLSDYNMEEAMTRKKIIEISNEVFVAADSSKFGNNLPISICTLDSVNYIITDSLVDKVTIKSFKNINCKLILAD